MSFSAIAWALEQGREQKLPTGERMLLVAIANALNGKTGRCDPGQATLRNDTGLTERHIRDLAVSLVRRGLLQIMKVGRALHYRLLMDSPTQTQEPTSGISETIPEQAADVVHTKQEPGSGNGQDDTGTWSHRYRNSVPKYRNSVPTNLEEPGREPKEPPRGPPVAGGRRRAPKFRNGFHLLDGGLAAPTIDATAEDVADFQAFHGRLRSIAHG